MNLNIVSRVPWKPLVAVLIALGVGYGIGTTSGGGDEQSLRSQLTSLKGELETAQADAAEAGERADQAQDELNTREAELNEREAQLDERERDLGAQEQRKEQNSFGDGIWQVGVDFKAGTYRAPGGSGCYWALLGSADTDDIITNGFGEVNQTLEIDSPFFQTNDCGTWEKFG